jgi:hypothetical protein
MGCGYSFAEMSRLFVQANLICLSSLLVPPAFVYLGAYELGFGAGAIIAAFWIGVVAEAWIDFGRRSFLLLLSGFVVLFWPGYFLVSLSACWVGVGCR